MGLSSASKLFADDNFLLKPTQNINEGIIIINNDLKMIEEWCSKWLVTMNIPKTKAILFSKKRTPSTLENIKLYGYDIDVVKELKYLGIYFDNKLLWNIQTDNLIEKVNNALTPLYMLKRTLHTHTLLIMYKSFILPLFDYADTSWINLRVHDQLRLERVQYNATKAITGGMKFTDQSKLRTFLGLKSLSQRRELHCMALFFKIVSGKTPKYLIQILDLYRQIGIYNLRDDRRFLHVPSGHLYNSFFEISIKLWNKLPYDIRDINRSPKAFVLSVNRHLDYNTSPLCCRQHITRRAEIHINRIFLNFSQLNGDLFKRNLIDSPDCSCGARCETASHFFYQCNNYVNLRNDLLTSLEISNVIPNRNLSPTRIHQYVVNFIYSEKDTTIIYNALENYVINSNRLD